jgi:hypothetical protein
VEREIEESAALDKVRERMRDVEQDEKGMGLGKEMEM